MQDSLDSAKEVIPNWGRRKANEIFSALAHRDFRWSQLGATLSMFGTSLQNMALAWWVTTHSDSNLTLSWVKAAMFIPIALFSFAGGMAADRFNRRILLIALQWGGSIQALILCANVATDNLTVLLALSMQVLSGVFYAFEYPLRTVFQSDLAPGKDMGSARGISRGLEHFSSIIGQTLAGYLLVWLVTPKGYTLCFLLNALSFGAAILSLHAIKERKKEKLEPSPSQDLLRLVRRSPRLVELFAHNIVLVLFGMYSMALLPAFTKNELGGDSRSAGWLLGSMATGKILGSLSAGWVKESYTALPWARRALLVVAVAQVGFAYCQNLPSAMLLILVFATFANFNSNAGMTMLQKGGTVRERGRLVGLRLTIACSVEGFAILGAGWVSDQIGLRRTFIGSGALCLATALWVNVYFGWKNGKTPSLATI